MAGNGRALRRMACNGSRWRALPGPARPAALLVFAAAWLLSPAGHAVPVTPDFFGSWQRFGINNCSNVPDSESCAGFRDPIQPLLRKDASGVRQQVPADTVNESNASLFAEVTYDGVLDAPIIRSSATSNDADIFALTTVQAYQTYTYTGPGATTFDIGGTLTFQYSGDQGPNGGPDTGFLGLIIKIFDLEGAEYQVLELSSGDLLQVVRAGEELGGAGFNTWDAGLPPDTPLEIDVFSEVTVESGQSFLISVQMQTSGDRGGYTDAASTFVTGFANISDEVLGNLRPATRVPEPGTLALLLSGLLLMRLRVKHDRRAASA